MLISSRPRWREKEPGGGSVGGRLGREDGVGREEEEERERGAGGARGRHARVKGCYTRADIFAGLREGVALITVAFLSDSVKGMTILFFRYDNLMSRRVGLDTISLQSILTHYSNRHAELSIKT